MATGRLVYHNSSGAHEIVSPREYQEYNVTIGTGELRNLTSATLTLYTEPNGGGSADMVPAGDSKYVTTTYRSCKFTS